MTAPSSHPSAFTQSVLNLLLRELKIAVRHEKKNVEDPFQAVKRENQNLWCLHRVRKDKGFHTERHETKDA